MAFLRRSKEETIEEEVPVDQEAVAEQTEKEEQQVPRYSQLPDTSFNVMSVRFTARKNANIALFVMLGLVALGILFLGTTYLDTRSSQQEAIEAADAARIEADRLSAEIAAKVQTGGLGPDKLNELIVQRHSAFLTATQNKLDYGRVLADLASVPIEDVILQQISLTQGESPEITVSARTNAYATAALWHQYYGELFPYVEPIDEKLSVSGTETGGYEISFTSGARLTADAFLDRALQYGIVIVEGAEPGKENAGKPSEDEEVAEDDASTDDADLDVEAEE